MFIKLSANTMAKSLGRADALSVGTDQRMKRAGVAVLCASGILYPVRSAQAQSGSACSAAIVITVESTIASDSSGPPFPVSERRRPLQNVSADTDDSEICATAVKAVFQSDRSIRVLFNAQLERLLADGTATTGVMFATALVRNASGNYEAVLNDTDLARNLDPLVRFEFSRALLFAGRLDDAYNLLRTAVISDSGVAALLYHYTYPVLSADSRALIARTRASKRGETLLREWDRISWSSGLTTSERLAIHFSRIAHADSAFPGVARPMSDSTEVVGPGGLQADPRKEIYIRFGEPFRIVRTPYVSSGGGPSAEDVTWVYADPTKRQPMLYHFTGANGRYSLITSRGCRIEWLNDRATLSPRIGQVYQACTQKSDFRRVVDQLRRETQDEYRENRYREFVVPSTLNARFAYRFYTFGDERSAVPEVVAVLAMPADQRPSSGTMRIAALLSDNRGSVRTQTTDYRPAGQADVMAVIPLKNVPEGLYSYRLRMSDLTFQEGFVYGGEYTVQLRGAGGLKMSDLVIAKAGTTGPLRRGDEHLEPILGALSDSIFDLYGEAYGAAAEEIIDVEVTVSRKRFLRRTNEVTLKVSDTVSESGVFTFRRVVRHSLAPGEYEITISMRTPSAGSATQTATIEIR